MRKLQERVEDIKSRVDNHSQAALMAMARGIGETANIIAELSNVLEALRKRVEDTERRLSELENKNNE